MYKSAVQNKPVRVSQPKPKATQVAKPPPLQRQQQQQEQEQEQDSDKMDISSTKSEILEISATSTIHTLATYLSSVTHAVEGLQREIWQQQKQQSEERSESSKITNSERKG